MRKKETDAGGGKAAIRAHLPSKQTNPDARTYDLGAWGVPAVPQFGWCGIMSARQRGRGFHSHGSYQITFCTKGVMTFEAPDGTPWTLMPGRMLVLPPGQSHRLCENARGNVRYWLFVSPKLSPRTFRGLLDDEARALSKALRGLDRHLYRLPSATMKLPKAMYELLAASGKPTWENRLRVRELVLRLLLDILAAAPVEAPVSTAIGPVVARMRRNPAEDWSLRRLVDETGYSSTTLADLFRRETGKTPHRFLVSCRIRRAKALLKTSRRIVDIAQELGFVSSQHFATVFLHETGRSPAAWRRECS